jgi:predicted nucleic acid-binding protein
VTVLLDTNVLVRHFTGAPRGQSRRATAFLESARELWLVDLVVAETVYVLRSYYGVPREQVAALLRAVIAFPAVSVVDTRVLHRALDLFEAGRLDFAEAYLVALAETSRVEAIASFDRSLDRVETVTRVEP